MALAVQLVPWLAVVLIGVVQLLRERSYREAKQAQLDAKDETIRTKDSQISALHDRLDSLEKFSIPRVEEYFATQQRIFERHAEQVQNDADCSVRAISEERARLEAQVSAMESRIAELQGLRDQLDERRIAWLRDRQDAETKLQGYRERGAELLEQMRQIREAGPEGKCPACERPLGEDFERVLGELEDQWTGVVQDGKWWKSRREQLERTADELGDVSS